MTVLDRLQSRFDADVLVTGADAERYAGAEWSPDAVVRPIDEERLADVVRAARDGGVQIIIRGRGTKPRAWAAPRGPTVLVVTDAFNRIVEYAPRDMTVTVQAGIRLAELNERLAEEGQRLPLDPPHADATLGGVLATNDSGPIRFGHGTARDFVIGMRMVLADGRVVKSGGKVVKNVAGYDLHKLFLGSAGTLGVIAAVTLKLRPLPEARRLVVLRPDDSASARDWVARIARGPTRPTMIEWLNAPVVESCVDYDGSAGMALVVGFEEMPAAVDWQCDRLAAEFGVAAAAYDIDASRSLYEALRDWRGEPATLAFKATMQPSHLAGFADEATRRGWSLQARAGNGVVYARTDEPHRSEHLADLRRLAAAGGGSLVVTHSPTSAFDGGGQADACFVMDRVKDRFDPLRIFGEFPFGDGSPADARNLEPSAPANAHGS